ncbi:MAG: hypothetical protein U0002_20455 [Thermoanaerobaculia bacterium]
MALPLLLAVVAFVLLALAGAWASNRARRALQARYQTLLSAVELTQRQLTELRSQQDQIALRAARLEERLDSRLEPLLVGLARRADLIESRAELVQALASGKVSAETAAHLEAELTRLGAELAERG